MRERSSEEFISADIKAFCVRNLSTDRHTNRSTAAMRKITAIGGVLRNLFKVSYGYRRSKLARKGCRCRGWRSRPEIIKQ